MSGGPGCLRVVVVVVGGGVFETSPPESRALAEAPWLMGGRGVNSNAAKLYLIFIHMNAAG